MGRTLALTFYGNLPALFVIKGGGVKRLWTHLSPVESGFFIIIEHNGMCIDIFSRAHTHTHTYVHRLVLPSVGNWPGGGLWVIPFERVNIFFQSKMEMCCSGSLISVYLTGSALHK